MHAGVGRLGCRRGSNHERIVGCRCGYSCTRSGMPANPAGRRADRQTDSQSLRWMAHTLADRFSSRLLSASFSRSEGAGEDIGGAG